MTRWLANAQAATCLLGAALVCNACAALPIRSGSGVQNGARVEAPAVRGSAAAHSRDDASTSVPATIRPAPLAKHPETSAETAVTANGARDEANAGEGDVSAASAIRIETTCALRSVEVDVTDQGGVALNYTAQRGSVERLRDEIRALVRKHNARSTRLARSAFHGFFAGTSSVLAISNDAPQGIRVVLVPPTPDSVPDVFANTELYAPDLLPDPEWIAERRRRCGA